MILAVFVSPRAATANGRFPQAQQFETVPGAEANAQSTVFLRTTWGVLVSRDAGKSWRWICERALGYEGQWDPPIAVTKDGRLWVGLEDGVVSTVDGCTVERATEMNGQTVRDFTTDPKGETLWAITSKADTKPGVWRRPAGAKFEKVGEGPLDVNFMTIEVSASKPQRLYVTGQPFGTIRGWLFVSDDGGKTLRGDKNDLPTDGPFFIAAVDPKEPDRVLMRRLHTTGSDLVLTKNAGKSFDVVLTMKSGMLGFAKAPDGKTLWAGSGLAEHGLFRSVDRGDHFEHVASHGVLCLKWARPGELFACQNPFTRGAPAFARLTDDGKTLASTSTFGDVAGPVSCPAGSDAGAAICAGTWRETISAVTLGIDAGALEDASKSDTKAQDPPAPPKRSCACDAAVGAHAGLDRWWLIAGFFALVLWRRPRNLHGSKLTHSADR